LGIHLATMEVEVPLEGDLIMISVYAMLFWCVVTQSLDPYYQIIVTNNLFLPLGWRAPEVQSPFELQGIVRASEVRALIIHRESRRYYYVKVDDELDQGYKIKQISNDRVKLINHEYTILLTFYAPPKVMPHAGLIRKWMVIGPFPYHNHQSFDDVYQPEQQINLEATYTGSKGKVHWKPLEISSDNNIANLVEVFGPHENVAAYAYAEIELDAPSRGYIKLGSDDGIKVWINNQLVHSNNAARSLRPDEDIILVNLRAGVNSILLKITQKGVDWQFTARLVDLSGQPLGRLKQLSINRFMKSK